MYSTFKGLLNIQYMTTLQTFEGSFPPSLLLNDHQMSPTDRTDDMKTTAHPHQKNDHID